MPRVIVTAQIEDSVKWEEGFRTHGELFKSQTVNKPIYFNVTEQNEVVACFEPENLDTYLEILDSPATEEAMEFDGIKRDTVKVIVLDKEFDPR
ncbi:MAG: hypothetical protein ACR2P1_17210 [Pseudomonadales bacterium]